MGQRIHSITWISQNSTQVCLHAHSHQYSALCTNQSITGSNIQYYLDGWKPWHSNDHWQRARDENEIDTIQYEQG